MVFHRGIPTIAMPLTRFRPATRDRRVVMGEERACPSFFAGYSRSVADVAEPEIEGVFDTGFSLCRSVLVVRFSGLIDDFLGFMELHAPHGGSTLPPGRSWQ